MRKARTTALLFALYAPAALAADSLQLSTTSGPAPLTVKVTGPEKFVALGKNRFQMWVGCAYIIEWGDKPNSISPTGPMDSECSKGMEHIYDKPGSYEIKARTYHMGPTDGSITDWSDSVSVTVQ